MDVVTLGAALSIMKKMPDTAASSAAAAEDAADRAEEAARTLTIDDTLTEEGQAADSKAVGDALAEKLDIADLPDTNTVSNANQLLSEKYVVDTEPYHLRPSGGQGADREFDTIVGGSIVWNQGIDVKQPFTLIKSSNRTKNIYFPKGTSLITGHKYLLKTKIINIANNSYNIGASLYNRNNEVNVVLKTFTTTNDGILSVIFNSSINGQATGESIQSEGQIWIYTFLNSNDNDDATATFSDFVYIDLTQMFGSEIADYIYSLEQATVGAGVAWFRKYFPNEYYDYNPGELMHVSDLQSHDMVGFNLWDEEWKLGLYNASGNWEARNDYFSSKNMIPVIPSATYYFNHGKSTASTYYICYYDADGNFIVRNAYLLKPSKESFTVPSNAHFINFTLPAYDTIYNHDICINLSGTRDGEYEPYTKYSYPLDSSLTLRGIPKLVDGKLSFDGDIYKPDGTVERRYGTSAYESGDESLSNAITDGTNTVYKLNTPTTEQAQPFQSPQILDHYGTEEYVTTSIVPVGHETKYPENLRAKIEGLPWNFASLIAPVEAEFKATQNYTSGSLFIVNNTLYKATANIANGGTITPNTNCTVTTLAEIIAAL